VTAASKADPEGLELRASPRRIRRFRRRLVIGAAAFGSAAILVVVMSALQGPNFRGVSPGPELYEGGRKGAPDGLAALPNDYSRIKPDTPVLGLPLPGDLGRPILAQQREHGLGPNPNPGDQAAEAERQRLAAQALHARESAVFFPIAARPPGEGMAGQGGVGETVVPPADGSRLALDPEHDPNNQQRKLDFAAQRDRSGIYNPHALQTPLSPYQVMAGSVIAASLITGINSDLPGLAAAQVTENVYDTVTGRILLIPQGARLIGAYDSVVAFGQSRALLVWRRIVFPDGSSIEIDNLPATDAAGYAGLEDEVDFHTWRLIKGVALATLLGVGTELSLGPGESDLVRAIRQSTQQNVNQAGQRITQKNLDIQPTITIRPGWPLRVIVHKDLILKPYRGG